MCLTVLANSMPDASSYSRTRTASCSRCFDSCSRAVSVFGKNPMRFTVFWRISVRFCGFAVFGPPLCPPRHSQGTARRIRSKPFMILENQDLMAISFSFTIPKIQKSDWLQSFLILFPPIARNQFETADIKAAVVQTSYAQSARTISNVT